MEGLPDRLFHHDELLRCGCVLRLDLPRKGYYLDSLYVGRTPKLASITLQTVPRLMRKIIAHLLDTTESKCRSISETTRAGAEP